MARPDFNIGINGRYFDRNSTNPSGSWKTCVNADYVSEDVNGPAKRRKPSTRFIPPTAYYFKRYEYHRPTGTSDVRITGSNWSVFSGRIGGGERFNALNHFSGAVTDTTAEAPMSTSTALVKARLKLKDSDVNLGVAFGERKATSRQVGDTATNIAKAIRALRRGNYRDAARHLGIRGNPGRPRGSNWVNHWLGLQYGWKPLLSDIYGACDALSKRPKDDWRVTAKGSTRDETIYEKKTTPTGTSSPTSNFDAYHCIAVRKRGVLVRIDALPTNDLTMSLASLGVTNPLSVAWELVPFSFVVDWFLPVGNWLDSLDALLGYSSAWTSTSTYNETLWEDRGVSRTNYTTNAWVKNDWYGTKRTVVVNRSVTQGVPLPAFPRFKDPRSLGHMANGLALLSQVVSRR